jgi:hypothetical protein
MKIGDWIMFWDRYTRAWVPGRICAAGSTPARTVPDDALCVSAPWLDAPQGRVYQRYILEEEFAVWSFDQPYLWLYPPVRARLATAEDLAAYQLQGAQLGL